MSNPGAVNTWRGETVVDCRFYGQCFPEWRESRAFEAMLAAARGLDDLRDLVPKRNRSSSVIRDGGIADFLPKIRNAPRQLHSVEDKGKGFFILARTVIECGG